MRSSATSGSDAPHQFRPSPRSRLDFKDAFKNLAKVTKQSTNPVLRTAAQALQEYLQ